MGVGGRLKEPAAEEAASVADIRGLFALCETGGVSDSPRVKAGSPRQPAQRALGGERQRHRLCSEAITSSSITSSSITSWCSCSCTFSPCALPQSPCASPRSRSSRSTPSSLVDEDPPPALATPLLPATLPPPTLPPPTLASEDSRLMLTAAVQRAGGGPPSLPVCIPCTACSWPKSKLAVSSSSTVLLTTSCVRHRGEVEGGRWREGREVEGGRSRERGGGRELRREGGGVPAVVTWRRAAPRDSWPAAAPASRRDRAAPPASWHQAGRWRR